VRSGVIFGLCRVAADSVFPRRFACVPGSQLDSAEPSAASPLLRRLTLDHRRAKAVTHVETLAPRVGRTAEFPSWVDPLLLRRLAGKGVERPWVHQSAVAEHAWAGRSVVVATGTASGKSLGYLLPVLTRLLANPSARALYLAPTKALARDQLSAIRALTLTGIRAAAYDGDTPREERDWVRAYASYVLSNPDMISASMLSQHARWGAFWRGLEFVVIDECHHYRGVFGSHVAQVIRRLRRICDRYGAHPTFVLASATVADPGSTASRLTGLPVEIVDDDGSPRGPVTFALYEPPLSELKGEHGAPVRKSALSETAELLADLVADGVPTLAFVRSRRAAETTALSAKRSLAAMGGREGALAASQVAAYRAGYLPEERRALEAALRSGKLLGLAATNALELGIDISGLDAVLLAGFPGTLASLWQQAGRAGRRGGEALAVLIARDDPLDTYLVHHPEAVFGRPVEAAVLDPDNPYVLTPHLECAASEQPLRDGDLELFGPSAEAVIDDLVRRGRLRRRSSGWYWTARERPWVDLRGTGGVPISVVEEATGRLLGTVDRASAHTHVHEGALYLHQGESFVVRRLDEEDASALVESAQVDWTTTARDLTDLRVVEELRRRDVGRLGVSFGTVDVTNQVVGYQRKRISTGELLGEEALDLAPRELRTRAVWYVIPPSLLASAELGEADVPGAAHAAEHAAIGLLPLWATCDRWDIGGVSTALHPDTGEATIFVYDGAPGGAGFSERGFQRIDGWLAATKAAIDACECESGCPSCVQSPKCGNGNEPLDKAGASRLLDVVLREFSGGH
jgi:DEAD/DEAH box helicase domain-containing protein